MAYLKYELSRQICLKKDSIPVCFLSAYAEDHGVCPWMNALASAESFMY
jgi:hypothetical protein